MTRRVAVTGMGVVSAIGTGVDDYWSSLKQGHCGISALDAEWTREKGRDDYHPKVAQVGDFSGVAGQFGQDLLRTDRFTQFACVAAAQAMADSGFEITDDNAASVGAIIGSGIGGHAAQDDAYFHHFYYGKRIHPLTVLRTIPNAAVSHVSIRHKIRGPAFAIASACASGAHAIGVAAELIQRGAVTASLAGASEACLTYGCLKAWDAMRIMSNDLCRPFSRNRNGLVIGEGAGILFLEEWEHAKARGATIHAELSGFGMNADGKDMINPSLQGAKDAISLALRDIDIRDPEKVYINAHGTGTFANDPTETRAIREAIGKGADAVAVSSTKSMHGHLLGGAGAVEAIAGILALEHGFVPPTINFEEPDPDCDLDCTPNVGAARDIELTISNSFAFGGLNAVLVFSKAA